MRKHKGLKASNNFLKGVYYIFNGIMVIMISTIIITREISIIMKIIQVND
jgi:hypothetical protein